MTQVNSHASSACPETEDCTTIAELSGSIPEAMNNAAVSSILRRSSEGVWGHGDGVQIDDAEDAFVIVLDLHPALQRAKIVSDVEISGRLHAGENSGFHGKFPW